MSQTTQDAYQHSIDRLEKAVEGLTSASFGESFCKEDIMTLVDDAYDMYCDISDDAYRCYVGKDLHRLSELLDEHLTPESVEDGTLDTLINEIEQVRSAVEQQYGDWAEECTLSAEDAWSAEDTEDDSVSSQQDVSQEAESSLEDMSRYPVSPTREAFVDVEQAKVKRMTRYTKSEARFFDHARAQKASTQQLIITKKNNRKTSGTTTVVNFADHSTRAHIMSDAGAVATSLQGVNMVQLQSKLDASTKKHTVLAKVVGWHNGGTPRKWNRHKVYMGKADVGNAAANQSHACYQDNPSIGNLSNFVMSGVGAYGKDILPLMNRLTGEDPDSEKVLAQLFIKFAHDAKPITLAKLEAMDLLPDDARTNTAKRKIFQSLNKSLLLIVVKEVSRQMVRGSDTESFPFGTAIAQALILLRDGHLRLKQVFDADAPYGVFTGEKIMNTANRADLLNKFNRVFDLYNQKYHPDVDPNHPFLEAHPQATLVETREANRQLMLSVYHGSSDSEGDEYDTSDEETLSFGGV